MSHRAHRIVAILLLPILWPALVLAQQPAGVVTNLQGQATLNRPVLPKPIPVKMKDDLFVQDRIDTRENSIVRVLLGGKAVVTVRELSSFSITEEPGLARVDLRSGTLAVGVARSLLKPGEAIEIRTPNAVAAVRGSVAVVKTEVRDGTDATQAAFLEGEGDVCTLEVVADPRRRQDPTVCKDLRGREVLAVLGSVLGQIGRLTDQQLRELWDVYSSGTSRRVALLPADFTQATALAGVLAGDTPVGGFPPPPPLPLPTVGNLCVNCPATTTQAIQQPTSTVFTTLTKPQGLEPSFGNAISGLNCDDCFQPVQLPFAFPFQGRTFTSAQVESNGYIRLVPPGFLSSASCCDFTPSVSELLSGPPRLAVAWYDVDVRPSGSNVRFNTFPGRVVVTWDHVAQFSVSPPFNTFQVQLFQDGRIIFLYPSTFVNQTSFFSTITLVGVSPGGNVPDPGPTNFSSLTTTTHFNQGTAYQTFPRATSSGQVFGLAGSFIVFAPDGSGGWFVLDPPSNPALLSVRAGEVVTLQSPLLNNPLTPQTVLGAVAQVQGQVIVPDSVGPLVSLTGGPHSLAILPGTSIFDLAGSATAPEVVEGNLMTLGTDRPIRGDSSGTPAPLAVPLLQTSGASLGTEQVVRLDTALLEASAPLLNLTAGSTLTTAGHVINLANQANVSLSGTAAMVNLDSSIMNVLSGHFANVAASRLNVAGDFLRMSGNSTLNILNGLLLNVLNGGVASMGTFINFTGTGNVINVTNSLMPTRFVSGIPIFVAPTATANANISISGTPIVALRTAGTININGTALAPGATGGVTGSLIGIQGTGGTVRIGP